MISTRQSRPTKWFLAFFIVACCVTTTSVAEEVIIDFESDIVDTRTLRFTSVDSPLATFSNSNLLWVRNGLPDELPEYDGMGIETFGPTGITIEFLEPVALLSIRFGNDDPAGWPEDRALLVAYRDSEIVGQTTLLFNRNDLPDQTITIRTDEPFNKAVFDYVDSSLMPVSGLGEVIADVRFQVVPEPSWIMLEGIVLLYAAATVNLRRHVKSSSCRRD